MSKRFIDTGLFDDDWFMDLSKDAKLLWVYLITKCDHAGMIKLNQKLCKVQTDIKDLNEIIKQLGNRIITVSEQLYFIPKFIEFQYPNFPNSKVRQQSSAVDILVKHGLFDKENLTLNKELINTYDNDNGNDTVIDNVNVSVNGAEKKEKYAEFVLMFPKEYKNLIQLHTEQNVKTMIDILNNYKGANGKKYKSDYLAILNWVVDRAKKDGKYLERKKMP